MKTSTSIHLLNLKKVSLFILAIILCWNCSSSKKSRLADTEAEVVPAKQYYLPTTDGYISFLHQELDAVSGMSEEEIWSFFNENLTVYGEGVKDEVNPSDKLWIIYEEHIQYLQSYLNQPERKISKNIIETIHQRTIEKLRNIRPTWTPPDEYSTTTTTSTRNDPSPYYPPPPAMGSTAPEEKGYSGSSTKINKSQEGSIPNRSSATSTSEKLNGNQTVAEEDIETQSAVEKPETPCINDKYEQGLIAFDTIPNEMIIGESYDVVIQIDHIKNIKDFGDFDLEELKKEGEAIDGKTKIHATKIWRFMQIEIIAEDPEALGITNVFANGNERGFQEITCDMPAEWKYSIKPLKEGKQKVFFNVYVSEDGIEKKPFGKGSRSREISVIIIQSFMAKYGLPIAGISLLSLGGLLFFVFRKKKKEEASVKQYFTQEDINTYQKWLTKSESERVLASIIEKINGTTHSVEQEAVLCLSNLKQVKKEHDLGMISFDDYSRKVTNLNQFVINLVTELSGKE